MLVGNLSGIEANVPRVAEKKACTLLANSAEYEEQTVPEPEAL
jgi:hypothetical protein